MIKWLISTRWLVLLRSISVAEENIDPLNPFRPKFDRNQVCLYVGETGSGKTTQWVL